MPWFTAIRTHRAAIGLVLAVLIAVSSYGHSLWKNGERRLTLETIDEAAWVYSSYYYYLAWRQFDLQSEDWKHFDAFDHPPLMKYLVGAAMNATGYVVDTIELKEDWISASAGSHHQRIMISERFHRTVPDEALFAARSVSTLSFFLASLLVYFIGWRVFSPLAGVAAVVLMALAPLQRRLASEVFSDGPLILLIVAAVSLQLLCVRALRERKATHYIGLSISLGLVFALLVNTKLSGLAGLPIAAAALVGSSWYRGNSEAIPTASTSHPRRQVLIRSIMAIAIIATACSLFAMLLNPLLLQQPLKGMENMIRLRFSVAEAQHNLFFERSMPTTMIKLARFTQACFSEGLGLGIVSFLFWFVGMCTAPALLRKNPVPGIVLYANVIGWTCAIWLTLPFDEPRYLLPLAPFFALVAGAGVESCASRLRMVSLHVAPRVAILFLALVASSGLLWAWSTFTYERFAERNPEWVHAARLQAEEELRATRSTSADDFDWSRAVDLSVEPENAEAN